MSVRGVWDTFERRCSFKSEGIRVDVYANPTLLSVWVHLPSPVQVADSDAAEALKAIDIEDGEQLEVHIDGASALLRSAGAEPDWNRLHRLIAFMRTLPAAATPEALDPLKVPADLRKLFPLVAKWGKSDDAERGDLIDGARTASLERLVARGRPLLSRIAEFLGEPDVSGPNEAAALDSLAQAVMEAELELRRRSDHRRR